MSNNYIVSQNSVITCLVGNKNFLTCGGSNDNTPKNGIPWANLVVNSSSFQYLFNCSRFSKTSESPLIKGISSTLALTNIIIKNFLYNNATIAYVFGSFNLIPVDAGQPPTCQNIMFFNPLISDSTGQVALSSFSTITFTGVSTTVNIGVFSSTSNLIYIAGKFSTATDSTNSSNANIALLDTSTSSIVANRPPSDTVINGATTIINSLVVVGTNLYVGGTDGGTPTTNCVFKRISTTATTSGAWFDLLGGSFAGTINTMVNIAARKILVIGGQFTTIKTATNCNNIVLYNYQSNTWTNLGAGVSGVDNVGLVSPWSSAQVFSVTNPNGNILWIGGYFYRGGGSVKNSIATFDLSTNTWGNVSNPTVVGVKYFNDDNAPGVVYSIIASQIDTSTVVIGGSFKIVSSKNQILYNLAKITTPKPTQNKTSKFNSISIP